MELSKNQYVVFPNGRKEGYLEARWSERAQAFYTFFDKDGNTVLDENGDYTKVYSTDIREKPARKHKAAFVPSATSCTVKIAPCGETEKAYQIEDGSNGCISRGNMRVYYKYIAKSICWVAPDGAIYAPAWA